MNHINKYLIIIYPSDLRTGSGTLTDERRGSTRNQQNYLTFVSYIIFLISFLRCNSYVAYFLLQWKLLSQRNTNLSQRPIPCVFKPFFFLQSMV